MNTGKAIFFGLALIALAIFARDVTKQAQAQSSQSKIELIGMGENYLVIHNANANKIIICDSWSNEKIRHCTSPLGLPQF